MWNRVGRQPCCAIYHSIERYASSGSSYSTWEHYFGHQPRVAKPVHVCRVTNSDSTRYATVMLPYTSLVYHFFDSNNTNKIQQVSSVMMT